MEHNNNHIHRGIIGIVGGIFILVIGVYLLARMQNTPQQPQQDTAICTQDAKMCWDGSFVSRQGQSCEFTPCPDVITENAVIKVTEPVPFAKVGLPITIKGEARTFESTVNIRLTNSDKSILTEDIAMAQVPDSGIFGPFSIELSYPKPKTNQGFVEVFEYSAKDGAEISKITIPITFAQQDTTTVSLFFNNTSHDPNLPDCSIVYPIERRIAVTGDTNLQAIKELIKGPSLIEQTAGYISSIPQTAKLNTITSENNNIIVDFSNLDIQGGSCAVMAVRAQIIETIKALTQIENITISIQGETEDILQP
ncbi:MAG: hypothetical protein A3H59_01320 [Candidatus Jacksonbacteria bacterium RIFCSPLOWO2_02_FULL_43_9]|nr:MAG: hypothetical protein UV70_C0009G0023 [Parcubacteria group bacterium GW2011_GWA2_43_13]OGY73549.1 MAG: hypothetical protein A3H59_01320 [Candidatus Jacksonbacteria bacterium RIFCSPLOWO2_02_FULL_43_9]HAZ17114.1 hypothetical protein [Candidatus Jacksonbacteria bacterium]